MKQDYDKIFDWFIYLQDLNPIDFPFYKECMELQNKYQGLEETTKSILYDSILQYLTHGDKLEDGFVDFYQKSLDEFFSTKDSHRRSK